MQFLRRTTLGIALRAAAEDFTITRAMGVRADRVVVSAFAISGALAAIAGILWLAGSGSVVGTSGFVPLVKGFIAAVVGGLGSLVGAVAGGFLIAALEVASRAYLPEGLRSVSDAIVFGVLIVVLLLRPAGLFPTRERAA
jgi:branched-chain amino acid transport system permease protein